MAAFITCGRVLPPADLFAWSLGAPYHVGHAVAVDGPEPPVAERARKHTVEMLSRDWGVEGRADLVERMNNLGTEGHRRRHRELVNRYATLWRPDVAAARERCAGMIREGGEDADGAQRMLWLLDAVQDDAEGIRGAPLLAFDAARGIMLARDGLALGWLTEAETWDYLHDVARDVLRTFSSWEAYGADFRVGRNVWARSSEPDWADDAVVKLLKHAKSPWRTLPWGAPNLGIPRPVRPLPADAAVWTLERG